MTRRGARKAAAVKRTPAKKPAAKRKPSAKPAATKPLAVEVRILNPRIGLRFPLPEYATDGSAAMDLCACLDNERIIMPGNTLLIGTGIAINIRDAGFMGLIAPRSGLSLNSRIILANQVGVIDSDYQGEIKLSLWNAGEEVYTLKPGERVAQLMLVPVRRAELVLVDEFSEKTGRGVGGFGHTGRL